MSSFPTTQPHDADDSASIAPPTDPRLALLGQDAPMPDGAVRADRWLGESDTDAPTAPTADAWAESEHTGEWSHPAPTPDSLIDGAVMPRRRWELGDEPDTAQADAGPAPWPDADAADDFSIPTLQHDALNGPGGLAAPSDDMAMPSDLSFAGDMAMPSDLSFAGDMSFLGESNDDAPDFGGAGFDDSAFDFGMLTDHQDDGPMQSFDHAGSGDASGADDGSSKRTFLAAIDSAATALSNSLPGRRKRSQDDEAPVAIAEIDDPLFAEALASSDQRAGSDDPFGFETSFGTDTPAPHHDVTEVTLSEYVDQHMGTDAPPPAPSLHAPAHGGTALLEDLPSPFADSEPILGQTVGDDFFKAPEPSPEDPVMALMADESEVELGRSSKHKLLLTGAGVAGVALLGIGAIGMLNRSGVDTPFGGGSDEAPVTLALDETPAVPLTDQLAASLVGISAPTCATATGGTGVLVSPTTVVTSSSVTGTAPTVEIVLANGETRVGTLIGIDGASELAVVNLDRPADDALEWGATNSIAVGDSLAVSGVVGDESIVEATLGGTTRLSAQVTEITLAAELDIEAGGTVVNDKNQVIAVALPRAGGIGLLTSDILRPLVSEFRLDPERFDGC